MGRRGNYVVPQEGRIQQWIDIPAGMEIPAGVRQIDRIGAAPLQVSDPADLDGLIVDVELLEFPEEGGRAAGRVIEILGHPDDFGIDEMCIRDRPSTNSLCRRASLLRIAMMGSSGKPVNQRGKRADPSQIA